MNTTAGCNEKQASAMESRTIRASQLDRTSSDWSRIALWSVFGRDYTKHTVRDQNRSQSGRCITYLFIRAPIVMVYTVLGAAQTTLSNAFEHAKLTGPPAGPTIAVNSDLRLVSRGPCIVGKRNVLKRRVSGAYTACTQAPHPHIPLLPAPDIISLTRQCSTHSFEYTLTGGPRPATLPSPSTPPSHPLCRNSSLNSTCCISVRRWSRDTGST